MLTGLPLPGTHEGIVASCLASRAVRTSLLGEPRGPFSGRPRLLAQAMLRYL